jgi:D-alanine-D-alanine ligase-like ATP-grasp enzyme
MPQTCLYCGNNPIPHATHKFYESMDILFSPIRRALAASPLGRAMDLLGTGTALVLYHTLRPLGLIQINRDLAKIPYPRAQVIWEEALGRHIDIAEIKPFNRSIDLYVAKLRGRNFYFMNLPRREHVATSNLTWIDDKFLLKQKLRAHGLPVAPGGAFTTLRAARAAFRRLAKPVIVKPRAGSRGRHTTTFIYTEADLIQAFKIAKQLCHWVIVEEHLYGDVQRGTVIGGQLVGVLGGSSPKVTGDGQHTIAELIQLTDAKRPAGVDPIKTNPYFMQRQGLNLETILPADKTVALSEKIGVHYGGTSYNCTDECHPDTKRMFEDAAKLLDISILGFDFIIPNITKSWKEQKCGIIECNGAPFIQLHHDPLIGSSINAAKYVWDLVV